MALGNGQLKTITIPLFSLLTILKSKLYIDGPTEAFKKDDLRPVYHGHIEIEYPDPKANFIKGLRSSGSLSIKVAEKIFHICEKVMLQFEALCRTIGKMKDLPTT